MLKGKNKKFSCKFDIRAGSNGLNGDLQQDSVFDINTDTELVVLVNNKNGHLKESRASTHEE